jgi:RNA polymerase sigma-32 factor
MAVATQERARGALELYLSEINRFPLLSLEEEQRLARSHRDLGDTRAAHALVTANLRFVVKVAHEYRAYGLRLADLIQEGNIGLMRAVQKFDPDKGIRLISYAVWWIRAYIQNFLLRSWSMVKVGTTQAQRKLFFSLGRTRRALCANEGEGGLGPDDFRRIARRLRVKPSEVEEMEQRMDGRDVSLDAPVGEDGGAAHLDFVAGREPGADLELGEAEEKLQLRLAVAQALERLDERERFIIVKRVMSDRPMTLKELGEHFGFSRERARQLEIRAKQKLRSSLGVAAAEADWPVHTDAAQVEIEDAGA